MTKLVKILGHLSKVTANRLGIAATILLALAVGIGANSVIFDAQNSLLLQALPSTSTSVGESNSSANTAGDQILYFTSPKGRCPAEHFRHNRKSAFPDLAHRELLDPTIF